MVSPRTPVCTVVAEPLIGGSQSHDLGLAHAIRAASHRKRERQVRGVRITPWHYIRAGGNTRSSVDAPRLAEPSVAGQ